MLTKNLISRRDFLKLAGLAMAGGTLAACTPAAAETPVAVALTITPSSTRTPAPPTVDVCTQGRNYTFKGSISREVLENYLSRSITMMDLCTDPDNLSANIQMLKNVGAKFAGRTLYLWGCEQRLNSAWLEQAKRAAEKIHAELPELILQAAVFEIVTTQVNEVTVPKNVFEAFGLADEQRSFRYPDMLFDSKWGHNEWGEAASIPDMTKLETQMWFYYLATSYIDAGMEAIHFGQINSIGAEDWKFAWKGCREMLSRVRDYAKEHARRGMVLCDAHTPAKNDMDGGPYYKDQAGQDQLLLDFHSFPACVKEVSGRPQEGILELGFYAESLYQRSKGGMTPSGWICDQLPYLVELDNWGVTDKPDQPGQGELWMWGYDEITWFAHQPEEYRNGWLEYAWHWVQENDPQVGFLQMPGCRVLAGPYGPAGFDWWTYYAHTRDESSSVPAKRYGGNQEETIREIWCKSI